MIKVKSTATSEKITKTVSEINTGTMFTGTRTHSSVKGPFTGLFFKTFCGLVMFDSTSNNYNGTRQWQDTIYGNETIENYKEVDVEITVL